VTCSNLSGFAWNKERFARLSQPWASEARDRFCYQETAHG
jgi:hypothetical protein